MQLGEFGEEYQELTDFLNSDTQERSEPNPTPCPQCPQPRPSALGP